MYWLKPYLIHGINSFGHLLVSKDNFVMFSKGEVVVMVVTAIISAAAVFMGYWISAEMSRSEQDIEVIGQFAKTYYNTEEDQRRLAVHLIKLLSSEEKRNIFSHFVIWDTLERNVHEAFSFKSELDDWHLLGDVIYGLRNHEKEAVNEYWCDVNKTALDRWNKDETKRELKLLFSWIREIYQQDDIWEECSTYQS